MSQPISMVKPLSQESFNQTVDQLEGAINNKGVWIKDNLQVSKKSGRCVRFLAAILRIFGIDVYAHLRTNKIADSIFKFAQMNQGHLTEANALKLQNTLQWLKACTGKKYTVTIEKTQAAINGFLNSQGIKAVEPDYKPASKSEAISAPRPAPVGGNDAPGFIPPPPPGPPPAAPDYVFEPSEQKHPAHLAGLAGNPMNRLKKITPTATTNQTPPASPAPQPTTRAPSADNTTPPASPAPKPTDARDPGNIAALAMAAAGNLRKTAPKAAQPEATGDKPNPAAELLKNLRPVQPKASTESEQAPTVEQTPPPKPALPPKPAHLTGQPPLGAPTKGPRPRAGSK